MIPGTISYGTPAAASAADSFGLMREDRRVAAFESHHAAARLGEFNHVGVDFLLLPNATAALVAAQANFFGLGRNVLEQNGIYQVVVQDDFGPGGGTRSRAA